jgi:hypothetical protein
MLSGMGHAETRYMSELQTKGGPIMRLGIEKALKGNGKLPEDSPIALF